MTSATKTVTGSRIAELLCFEKDCFVRLRFLRPFVFSLPQSRLLSECCNANASCGDRRRGGRRSGMPPESRSAIDAETDVGVLVFSKEFASCVFVLLRPFVFSLDRKSVV